jgi:hypothetical protein
MYWWRCSRNGKYGGIEKPAYIANACRVAWRKGIRY